MDIFDLLAPRARTGVKEEGFNSCRKIFPPLIPARLRIHAVTVVPILAPMITPTACRMGQALERRAGGQLRTLLGKLTSSRTAGLLTGIGVAGCPRRRSLTAAAPSAVFRPELPGEDFQMPQRGTGTPGPPEGQTRPQTWLPCRS